jgi:hypothetical protein
VQEEANNPKWAYLTPPPIDIITIKSKITFDYIKVITN